MAALQTFSTTPTRSSRSSIPVAQRARPDPRTRSTSCRRTSTIAVRAARPARVGVEHGPAGDRGRPEGPQPERRCSTSWGRSSSSSTRSWCGCRCHQQLISDFISDGGASFFGARPRSPATASATTCASSRPAGPGDAVVWLRTGTLDNRGNDLPGPAVAAGRKLRTGDLSPGNLPAWDCKNVGKGTGPQPLHAVQRRPARRPVLLGGSRRCRARPPGSTSRTSPRPRTRRSRPAGARPPRAARRPAGARPPRRRRSPALASASRVRSARRAAASASSRRPSSSRPVSIAVRARTP